MYQYVTEYQQFGSFVSAYQKVDIIPFDIETTGTDPFVDKLLLIQAKLSDTVYVFDTRKLGEKYVNYLVQLLKDSNKLLIGHNIKFDVKMICAITGELLTNVHDTMIAEAMTKNGIAKGKDKFPSLAELVEKYFGTKLDKQVRNSFIGKKDDEPITEQEIIYAATDVQYLEAIREKQLEKLTEQKQIKAFDLEMRVLPVIVSMELEGVKIDEEVWKRLGGAAYEEAEKFRLDLVGEFIEKALERCKGMANALEIADFLKLQVKKKGERKAFEEITDPQFVKEKLKERFNVNSDDQVLIMLRDVYGIPIENTNEKTIDKFIKDYEIIGRLLKYREFAKTVSTYGDKFLQEIHPATGRIHTEFNQLGMVSGRISSSGPNLQNIKKESEFRNAFIARPGKVILSIDYSQEELRLMAVVARVKEMIDAFNRGIDIHTKSGAGLFKMDIEELQKLVDIEDKEGKRKRGRGKTLNFAVGYGSTEWGLFKNFGIPMDEGKELLKVFFEELYPEINQCKQVVGEKILKLGYSTTLIGRKRFFEITNFFPGGRWEKQKYESAILREGFNHIIQGTGADIMKESLCRIFFENPFGDGLKILIQIYDELVIELDESIAEEGKEFVSKIMLEVEGQYLKGVVPAAVDAKLGKFWRH